jgi:opacity protein-like surface antigen
VDVDSFIYWEGNSGVDFGAGELRFESGPALSLAVGGGMSMPGWLHLELETGVSQNSMELELPGLAVVSGDYWQVPLLVNATVPWALTERVDLYGGLGLGAVLGVVDLSSATAGPGWVGSMDVAGSKLSAAGALQLIGGVRYRVSESGALALGYRFRGTTPPKWSASKWDLDLDRVFTHTVSLVYEWKW